MRNLIRQIRESLALSKAAFSRLLDVHRSTVNKWESGERTPTGRDEIGALLRVAPPELQARLLDELGIDDVTAFAADLLAAAAVQLVTYQGYTSDIPEDVARVEFEKKYGHPPVHVIRRPSGVLAGPVEQQK